MCCLMFENKRWCMLNEVYKKGHIQLVVEACGGTAGVVSS